MTSRDVLSQFPEIREMKPFKHFVDEGRIEGRTKGRTEGRTEGLRMSLQIQRRAKFGPPKPEQEAALKTITDPDRLETLCKRILDVNTWDELLAEA
jgi:hypothetical protein